MQMNLDDSRNDGLIPILGQPAIGDVLATIRDLVASLNEAVSEGATPSAASLIELLDPDEQPLASFIELRQYLASVAVEGNVQVRLEKYKHGLSTRPSASRKARQEIAALCEKMHVINQHFAEARRAAQRLYAQQALRDIEQTTQTFLETLRPLLEQVLNDTR